MLSECIIISYLLAYFDMHYQRQRKYGVVPPCAFCPCRPPRPWVRTQEAPCTGSQWRRRARSRSAEENIQYVMMWGRITETDGEIPVITHINHPCCVTFFEVVQHRGLVEVGHHDHVLDLVILWGVHGITLFLLDCYNLRNKMRTATWKLKQHMNKQNVKLWKGTFK